MFDDVLNPFDLDDRSIWARTHGVKVLCELHCLGSTVRPSINNQPNVKAQPLPEAGAQRTVG
jgi:hypothetical protein